ncbi:MAG: hypothetical protein DHS20C05_21050 [Hyphococcus sp.]|nr:MAG: hypothetical protein DHS20C05_21050 [Marinicaulis sp.]
MRRSKLYAPARETVNIRRLDLVIAVRAEQARALIVCHNENDIWALCCFSGHRGQKTLQKQSDKQ